jgi:hypothetical protein
MIFRKQADEDFFNRCGYIQHSFLGLDEINALQKAFITYNNMNGEVIDFAKELGYYISVFDSNTEKRKYINDTLKNIFTPKVEALMNNYTILYGNFMYKEAGGKEIEVHQDFSFVDEKKYTAFNLWIPLQDTNPENGGFHLIESSNKLFNSYRSSTIPHNLTHYNEAFKKLMKAVDVKAGDGLLFDHRLFHYSTPNRSDKIRIAVQMVLIPKEATPVMYYYEPQKDKKNLSVYEMTENFLLTKNLWSNPTDYLRKIGETPYEKIPDAGSILRQLQPEDNTPKPLKLLKKLFGHV